MKRYEETIVYWLPRVLAVAFVVFISLFAFDVFDQPQWWWAFLIHLLPSFVLLALTLFAWKFERAGGALFILAAIGLMALSSLEAYVVYLPAFLIGGLFLLSSFVKR